MAGKRTRADQIRETLAERIVHGYLEPGDALDESSLSREFGVSRTPVREALRQLEANGLAQCRPHRGTVVRRLSEAELDEAFVVMAELEALCARLCAIHLERAARDDLMRLHEKGEALAEAGDVVGYRRHNTLFHEAIYRGAANDFLRETIGNVRRRLAPFRNLQFEAARRPRSSHSEHGTILAAIAEHDEVAAAQAMRAHILTVRSNVAEVEGQLRRAVSAKRA